MGVRKVLSRRMFGKNTALKYPAKIQVIASGAPSAPVSTNTGCMIFSVATKGCYIVNTGAAIFVASS